VGNRGAEEKRLEASNSNTRPRSAAEPEASWRVALRLGVATLYEASGLPCALDPSIRPLWPGARLCGPAFTVRCQPGDNLAIHYAVEQVPPGCVLVVDVGGHLAGYWGEVLTVAAQVRGVAGLVIDGGVRDAEAIQRRRFPTFARGTAVFHTAKHDKGQIQVPVVIGGVQITPGDLVVGDGDGVLALPADQLERILQLGTQREAKEQRLMERLEKGESTLDIFGFR
jgi:4-hydroxy-4-methyl-2-oxoglutarate aldolase